MPGPRTIDLNADVGESFGRWRLGDDEALLDVVTSANVACGFHAGDPATLVATCRAAARRGVAIGAQVGYRDLAGFGRRFVDVSADDLYADVLYQLAALDGIARTVGSAVTYVKPHGALYNAVVHHEVQADAVIRAVADYSRELPVVGLPGSALLAAAAGAGLATVREAFADRGYTAAGTLVPRSEPGALLDDPEEVAAPSPSARPGGPRDGDRRRRGRARGRLGMRPRRLPRGRRHGPCRPKRLVGGRSPAGGLRATADRMRLLPCGDRAILVEVADAAERRRLDATLRRRPLPGTVEHVPGARTVLVVASAAHHLPEIAAALRDLVLDAPEATDETDELVVEVRYDGPDLDDVATHLGITRSEVVARHTGQVWTVEFAGFAPGFAYLTGSEGDLEVPRRHSPRTRIPAGSVGLAGPYSGVYPRPSPGGWQLIGRTDVTLWDAERDPPALLTPGRRVRFVEVAS